VGINDGSQNIVLCLVDTSDEHWTHCVCESRLKILSVEIKKTMSAPAAVKVHPPGTSDTVSIKLGENSSGIKVSTALPPVSAPHVPNAPKAHSLPFKCEAKIVPNSLAAPKLVKTSCNQPILPLQSDTFIRSKSRTAAKEPRKHKHRRALSAKDYELLINPDRTKPTAKLDDVPAPLAASESEGESESEGDGGSDRNAASSDGSASESESDRGRERERRRDDDQEDDDQDSIEDESDESDDVRRKHKKHRSRGSSGDSWVVHPSLEDERGGSGSGDGLGPKVPTNVNPMKNMRQTELNRRARVICRLKRRKTKYDPEATTLELEQLDAETRQAARCESMVTYMKVAMLGLARMEQQLAIKYPGYVNLTDHHTRIQSQLEKYDEVLYDIYDHYCSGLELNPIWSLISIHLADIFETNNTNMVIQQLMAETGIKDPVVLQQFMKQMFTGMMGQQTAPMPMPPQQQQTPAPPRQPSPPTSVPSHVPMHTREPAPTPAGPTASQGQLPLPTFRPYNMNEVVQMLHEKEDKTMGTSSPSVSKDEVKSSLANLTGRNTPKFGAGR
jgi:hypothetical protein